MNEALKQLHKGFTTQMTRILQPLVKNNQPYHPHFTIGYRDIPKEVFPEAMKDFLPRKFEAAFNVDSICFWKHNGTSWETIATLTLKKKEDSIGQASLF